MNPNLATVHFPIETMRVSAVLSYGLSHSGEPMVLVETPDYSMPVWAFYDEVMIG